jgi:hypothetical protein
MSKGIQFKVIGAAPTNGIVDRSTEIYTDGGWLPDLKKVHILPIFESYVIVAFAPHHSFASLSQHQQRAIWLRDRCGTAKILVLTYGIARVICCC